MYDLFDEIANQENQDHVISEVPKEVRNFLGGLSTLEDVPLYYLVPNEQLLPKRNIQRIIDENNWVDEEHGSIRFFYIDPFWIKCLLNGALEIAPLPRAESLLSRAMAGEYLAEVLQDRLIQKLIKQASKLESAEDYNAYLIAKLQEKGISINSIDDLDNIPRPSPSTEQNNWRFSGFLFRSTLISAWKDLRVTVKGRDNDNNEVTLRTFRRERIREDTMLYICEGMISNITIEQPAMTLHFGIDGTEGNYEKELRNDETVEVPFRNEAKGVMDLTALAGNIGATDSATFASEMVAQPVRNEIQVNFI